MQEKTSRKCEKSCGGGGQFFATALLLADLSVDGISGVAVRGRAAVLCALYHALQAEPPEKRGMRRSKLFAAAVAFPLVLSVLVTVGCFLYNPDLPVFHPLMEQTPSVVGYVALFSGRITITSLYGLAFARLDVLLLRLQEIRRSRKEYT